MKLETAIEALKYRGYGTEKDEQFYQDCIKTIEENVEELFEEIKELKLKNTKWRLLSITKEK